MTSARDRCLDWAATSVTQGEVLDAFAAYCDETDELLIRERSPSVLVVSWRDREVSTIEVADSLPAHDGQALVLTELTEAAVARLLDDAALRSRVAVYDLGRLEKANAVRSSAFVHFEWFLRDEYGVKVVASEMFTRGLVDRGVISLGFG